MQGKRLRNLRIEKEMSMNDLAKALNVSKSAISLIENGHRRPSVQMMTKYANYFKLDYNYIFDNEVIVIKDQESISVNNSDIELINYFKMYPKLNRLFHSNPKKFMEMAMRKFKDIDDL